MQRCGVANRSDWHGSSLRERLAYLSERLNDRPISEHGAAAALARKLEERKEQISRYLSEDRGKPEVDTLRRWAEKGEVSFVWLALGEGLPDDINPWSGEYCRELQIALAYVGDIYGPDILEEARREAKRGHRTPREWVAYLKALHDRETAEPATAEKTEEVRAQKRRAKAR